MVSLSAHAREAIMLQAINRGKTSIREIAVHNNIGYSTLQTWLRLYKKDQLNTRSFSAVFPLCDTNEKEKHVFATAHLDSIAKGAYCRQHGLYCHIVEQWRDELKNKNKSEKDHKSAAEIQHYKSEIAELKNKCKTLEKELNRKDKALSDASALLILKKKAELIWGIAEDD